MKFSMLLVLVLAISSPSFSAEWVNLFNGKNTEGWTPREEVETFEAIDGEIHLLATKNVWVTSQLQMDNFEASVEVLLPEDAKEAGLNISGYLNLCRCWRTWNFERKPRTT